MNHYKQKIMSTMLLASPWLVIAIILIGQQAFANANAYDKSYIHPAIPILDEDGNHVLNSAKAYSSKMTCGNASCHDYDAITSAFHFQMGRDEASDDFGLKRGMPQLVSPGYYGGYNCMGGSRPDILSKKHNASENEFMDHGSPGLVKRCATCHMGGGWMETDRDGIRYDKKDKAMIAPLDGDYYTRNSSAGGHHRAAMTAAASSTVDLHDWQKSGVVEADCMVCHADLNAFKKFPASNVGADGDAGADSSIDFWKSLRVDHLIKKDFFREANTALWEFYDIKPDSDQGSQLVNFARTPIAGKEGSKTGYSLNLGSDGKPQMTWNAAAFDENKKALIPMLRFPQNDNCMACHLTSNSRRGFYGFGDSATLTLDDDGVVEEDYQDDVHKGKTWTADNGEVRQIENCNTCHSRNYINPSYANMDLSADHNFLKGNSDMDVRNDLDFADNTRSCEYCHDNSANPVIPSGHDSMQSAHKELWKASGDMTGYESSSLDRITKTHLDVISCQACHIAGKKSRGTPLQIMYRYRQAEDGKLKIIPYNPRIRHYWKDKNSNRVLSSEEYKSVYSYDKGEDGKLQGKISDPISGEVLAYVSASSGRHGVSYGDPQSYEDFVKLKQAYDKLMQSKGYNNADMQQIWIESNEYLMSHNVRPAASSVQCAECHAKKQSGAFSSLISPNSILGKNSVKTVAQLPDKRLVDEGIVVLGLDYFKVDESGKITENMDDILYSTKINPFMSILKASNAMVSTGQFRRQNINTALTSAGLSSADLSAQLSGYPGMEEIFSLASYQGNAALKNAHVFAPSYGANTLLLPNYRVENSVITDIHPSIRQMLTRVLPGSDPNSAIHGFMVKDKNNQGISHFNENLMIKLPYQGLANDPNKIAVLYSIDGSTVQILDNSQIIKVQPESEIQSGYVLFSSQNAGYFVVMDR